MNQLFIDITIEEQSHEMEIKKGNLPSGGTVAVVPRTQPAVVDPVAVFLAVVVAAAAKKERSKISRTRQPAAAVDSADGIAVGAVEDAAE